MLPLQLTALLLVVNFQPAWYLRVPVTLLAGLALLFPRILRTPFVWLGLSLVTGARLIRFWPLEDNHHYLLAYWVLSIFLALCLSRPNQSLAVSARWLVAFVFLWATLWKGVLSPDYVDGRFYRVALLGDPRFEEKTELFAGLSSDAIAQARAYLLPTPSTVDDAPPPPVWQEPRTLTRLATFFTWSTLFIEGLLALAFLLPSGKWSMLVRNVLLLGFCLVTFAFAPILGFGWLLAAIGVAQVPESRPGWRWAYVTAFFLILLVQGVPWARLMLYIREGFV
ncbi:MAG TPA: hypothetical protein VEY33_04900 [Gemmatimonadota bacterium]|nr:hypothetical protein [Gemmatimonadota bacterium]